MSFTDFVTEELKNAPLQKTCCKKAMLYGLLFGGSVQDDGAVAAEFKSSFAPALAAEILKKQFSAEAQQGEICRAGRHFYTVRTECRAVLNFLKDIDTPEASEEERWRSAAELVSFRCPECSHAFLRGVFISTGSITDPEKAYHLEFSLKSERRAELIFDLLTSEEAIPDSPNLVRRDNRTGVYYKKNSLINDLLSYIGAVQSGFKIANICIKHDIKNAVNRATNCVAKNISRSVDTAKKQIDAIEFLMKTEKIHSLGDDLKYTAALRLENPQATLSELAGLHSPPISKSGLNRRLSKLLAIAQENN